MVCCAIGGCTNHGRQRKEKGLRFYPFPKDPNVMTKWIIACRRADPLNVSTAEVCSVHFQDSDYQRDLKNELLKLPLKRRLKPDAVPSLFLPEPIVVNNLTKIWSNNIKIGGKRQRQRKIIQRVLRTPSEAEILEPIQDFDQETVTKNFGFLPTEKGFGSNVLSKSKAVPQASSSESEILETIKEEFGREIVTERPSCSHIKRGSVTNKHSGENAVIDPQTLAYEGEILDSIVIKEEFDQETVILVEQPICSRTEEEFETDVHSTEISKIKQENEVKKEQPEELRKRPAPKSRDIMEKMEKIENNYKNSMD